jgi:Fe-S cluster biosynthesis and repair protein YggX
MGYAITMELEERIAQWEKMTREAPDDMAWFSLGNAYKDAQRYAEADRALAEALKCNAGMSRAYQLRGQVLIALNRNAEAGAVLTEGYMVAAGRGDVMPQRAMGSLLEKLGLPVPEVKAAAAVVAGADAIIDRKTGEPGTRMKDPPMRGPLGKFIMDHYSQETWRAWIAMGTKVINELRLDFSNPEHADVYDAHMMEWLGISADEVRAYAEQAGPKK